MKKLGCTVKFEKGNAFAKHYNYLTDIEGLERGDLIVVHARNEFCLAYFVEYKEVNETENTKWIIQKVDLEGHNNRIANAKRIKDLKAKLEEERRKTEELQIYEILAIKNPNIKELLDELKAIQGI